jgi:hypothetical protein
MLQIRDLAIDQNAQHLKDSRGVRLVFAVDLQASSF